MDPMYQTMVVYKVENPEIHAILTNRGIVVCTYLTAEGKQVDCIENEQIAQEFNLPAIEVVRPTYSF